MKTVTTREAQHHLAKVLALVEQGEEVVITRRGLKVARIEAYKDTGAKFRKVDWAAEIEAIKRELGHLPKFTDSTAELLRAEERY